MATEGIWFAKLKYLLILFSEKNVLTSRIINGREGNFHRCSMCPKLENRTKHQVMWLIMKSSCCNVQLFSMQKVPYYSNFIKSFSGFPRGSDGNESTCSTEDLGFDPLIGKISWRKEWVLTPLFLPGEFHGLDRGAWQATGHGITKSWT